jgi:hypothetical protein
MGKLTKRQIKTIARICAGSLLVLGGTPDVEEGATAEDLSDILHESQRIGVKLLKNDSVVSNLEEIITNVRNEIK